MLHTPALRPLFVGLMLVMLVGCATAHALPNPPTPPPALRVATLYALSAAPPVPGQSASSQTLLSAFDLAGGHLRWQKPTLGMPTAIAARDGQVSVATTTPTDSRVWTYDARDGSYLWSAAVGKVLQLVDIPGGVMVSATATVNGAPTTQITRLDAVTGYAVWTAQVSGGNYGLPPVVAGGALILSVALPAGNMPLPPSAVVALDLATGHELWRTRVPALLSGLAGDAEGLVLTAATTSDDAPQSLIAAIRPTDGALLWQLHLAGTTSPPALGDHAVILSSVDATGATVRSVARTDGQMGWQVRAADIATAPFAPPCSLLNGLVVLSSAVPASPQVVALSATTGAPAWRHPEAPAALPAAPLPWGDLLLVPRSAATGSSIEALSLTTGMPVWVMPLPGTLSFAPLVG